MIRFLLHSITVLACTSALASTRPAQPNIVIMMVDDMGLGDTSAYLGVRLAEQVLPIQKTLSTPNLKAFAEQAVLFTDAHAPASMCSSTRYSVLTGRFAHRAHLRQQGWLPHGPNVPMIHADLPTLPSMLQKNGYRTACIGKYHVGVAFDDGTGTPANDFFFHDVDFSMPLLDGPTHHGFDEFFGVPGNTEDPLDTEPRVMIRDDRFLIADRSKLHFVGMEKREGKILAAPHWDLHDLGPRYLAEVEAFLERQGESPFFLYYVPNSNHNQRHTGGTFAVPEQIAGVPIKGQSRYTDGKVAGPREDMVLENDVAFGKILEILRNTDDARWPGHPLIENTVLIFTSDNGPNIGNNNECNQESGGLRGKKARLWEGGIRVPFLVAWPGSLKPGTLHQNVFSLTDLYATLAGVVGHRLDNNEALDSHNCLDHWTGKTLEPDLRPRLFFCHLGPPYENDAIAMRKGNWKLVVRGGLAMPYANNGSRGAIDPAILYNLEQDLYETKDFSAEPLGNKAAQLGAELLKIHNQGHARALQSESSKMLIADDGWYHLRNDLDGMIGFDFRVNAEQKVTHLGMWDDHDKDVALRPARSVPDKSKLDQPTRSDPKRRSLSAPHQIRLERIDVAGRSVLLQEIPFQAGTPGELIGEFRYLPLQSPVLLEIGVLYRLTMSTRVGDGDFFHDPVGFDGLPPTLHSSVSVERALLLRSHRDQPEPIPSFSDMSPQYDLHRLPVGPSLLFALP